MSSAWLIRRFIDPDATFVFADRVTSTPAIPFDTFEAEFGHHGRHCTFETLCNRFGITDDGALWIGRVVHDLDLKEDTYHEPESATVGRLVEGLRRSLGDDMTLLNHGVTTFEALYQSAASHHTRVQSDELGQTSRRVTRNRAPEHRTSQPRRKRRTAKRS
jgi:hypothetical protein